MEILEQSPDRLVLRSGSGYAMRIGVIVLAILAAQWWFAPGFGNLATVVFVVGAVVVLAMMLAVGGSTQITADRPAGHVTVQRRKVIGGGNQTLPLSALQGATITSRKPSGSSRAYRCEILLAGQGAVPLTTFYGPLQPAEQAATAINAWVAAGSASRA
jgi:hypothetical protein